jgi:hypothetical protein
MSEPINDGGPAFPYQHHVSPNSEVSPGMGLRDYFAAAALQGLTTGIDVTRTPEIYAAASYRFADAMISQRNIRHE